MLSTQVVQTGPTGLSRCLVPGGIQIGRPTFMTYCQQQPVQLLPLPATSKRRPGGGCCCRPCVALVVSVVTLLLLLMLALLLGFLLPKGPAFTGDIVVEVSTLEYPYIENLLQRDARLFFEYENGFCRNLRMIITVTSYRLGADYGDCQLQAISRYIEDSQPTNVGSTFTLKLTLESSSRISRFTVGQVVEEITRAVTAGQVGSRLLFYLEGTRVLSFPGLRDPVFPTTVEVFLFLSIEVPGLAYDPDFEENNPEEFNSLQDSFCEHWMAAVVTLETCVISGITPLEGGRRRRRKRQTPPSVVMLAGTIPVPAATAGASQQQAIATSMASFSNTNVNGIPTGNAEADSSLTTTLPPPPTTASPAQTTTTATSTRPPGATTGTTFSNTPFTGTTFSNTPFTGTTFSNTPFIGTTPSTTPFNGIVTPGVNNTIPVVSTTRPTPPSSPP